MVAPMPFSSNDSEARVQRLRYRAWRRGFREADLILGPFADRHAASLDEAQLNRFESLLQQADHDLYDWIMERAPTPAEFDHDVMALLREHRQLHPSVRSA